MIRKPLLRYCESKQFDSLIDILKNDGGDVLRWIEQCSNKQRGQNALHLVLQHDPPRAVLDLLLTRMRQISPGRNPAMAQDKGGLTPLHVAVARSCHISTVERLIFAGATGIHNPASIADHMDRYPLHWACTNLANLPKPKGPKRVVPIAVTNMIRVVGCLVAACPMAVDAPDAVGLTPKEMALGTIYKTTRQITRLLDIGTKISQQQQVDDYLYDDVHDSDVHADVIKAPPGNHGNKFSALISGGSQSTEPTEASSNEDRPADSFSNECYFDDYDVSSIGWDEDEDIQIVFRGTRMDI